MNLPLDMRATTPVASLDAIDAAVLGGRFGEPVTVLIDELIAGARERRSCPASFTRCLR